MVMATTKAKEAQEAVEESIVEQVKKPADESVYSAAELAENYKAFQVRREVVVVALRLAGKKTATFAEAKNIIEKFKNKEVK